MGFGDRLRAWLRGDDGADRTARTSTGTGAQWSGGRATARPRRRDAAEGRTVEIPGLLAFTRSRRGVEAYLEPRTSLYGHSVLLVADDGEHLRLSVPGPDAVRALCRAHGLPVYDVARTGYPRRVRDYDRGVRPDRVELTDLPPWPNDEDGPPPPPTSPAAPPPRS
jgi:hypothetical protein